MDELLFVFLGSALGIITGFVPGIHVNTAALLAVSVAEKGNVNILILIVSMSIVHSFVDFIPSILLGAPEADNFLSVLPGHRLFLKGKAHYAIKLTIVGGLIGGIISLIAAPFYVLFILKFVEIIYLLIPFLLVLVLVLMILSERHLKNKLLAIIIIALSGILGVIVLRNFVVVENPLFPLITGFFGASTLIYSALMEKQKIIRQKVEFSRFNKEDSIKGSILGALGGGIVSLFPSVGPSQAAFIIRKIAGKIKTTKYLIVLGGINTSNMLFSFFVLYAIGKARTGSAAAIRQLMQLNESHLLLIGLTSLIAIGIGALATDLISRKALNGINKINYRSLNVLTLIFLFILTVLFSGFIGLLVMVASLGVGLIVITGKIKRTHSMAFLMIPTLLFYLGL